MRRIANTPELLYLGKQRVSTQVRRFDPILRISYGKRAQKPVQLGRSCIFRKQAHPMNLLGCRNLKPREYDDPMRAQVLTNGINIGDTTVVREPNYLDALFLTDPEYRA